MRVRGPVVEASRDEIVLRIPRVGRFVVHAGEKVEVEREPGATDADVSCFLRGPVAAAQALLRGAIPLHASAVEVGGRAVLIAGRSGVGKSGAAAALALRGHAVLADAVTLLAPVIEPLAPRPVLWPDLIEHLDLDPGDGELVRPALPKHSFALGPPASATPLAAIVFLRGDALCANPQWEAVAGAERAGALVALGWYRRAVAGLGLAQEQFAALSQLAASTGCFKLTRPRSACSPHALADAIEELAAR